MFRGSWRHEDYGKFEKLTEFTLSISSCCFFNLHLKIKLSDHSEKPFYTSCPQELADEVIKRVVSEAVVCEKCL